MLQKFDVHDRVLDQKMFIADEIKYNLVHRICGSKSSTCLRQLMKQWSLFSQKAKTLGYGLRKNLQMMIVEQFAEVYSEANGLKYFPHMIKGSYSCSELKKPMNVNGMLHQATRHVDSQAVSMANIAHRSLRHARINAVYTPSVFRKKGYASAIVAELCAILKSESLEPMLYADI